MAGGGGVGTENGADKKSIILLLRKMPANLNTTKATTERERESKRETRVTSR